MKRALLLAAALLVHGVARAETTHGSIVAIDRIEVTNPEATPFTAVVHGAFLSWNGVGYDAGAHGTVRLVCPMGREQACKAQWAAMAEASAKGQCAAMGWDIAPLPTTGDASWPVLRGARFLGADDTLCARAKAVPLAAPTLEPLRAPTPSPRADRVKDDLRWYGGYTFMVDAINIATAPAFVGIGGYFVAAPIVHLAHREYVRAAVSLSLRVTLPIAGVYLVCGKGSDLTHNCYGDFGGIGIVAGAAAGVLLAMLLDATAVSWTSKPEKTTTTIMPYGSIDRASARLGIAATF